MFSNVCGNGNNVHVNMRIPVHTPVCHESSLFQIHTYVMLITTSDGPPSQPFWSLSTRDSQLITRNCFFLAPLRCHQIIGAYDAL